MDETTASAVSEMNASGRPGGEIPPADPQAEFNERVERLANRFQDEPHSFYRAVAEIYLYISMMDEMMRAVQANGGPMKMVMAMMKGKKE